MKDRSSHGIRLNELSRLLLAVIPAKAGIQKYRIFLDSLSVCRAIGDQAYSTFELNQLE